MEKSKPLAHLPEKRGLYDPAFEHDSCGVGFVAHIKGVRSQLPGDLFCHVVVETPVSLTERQRQLLREFEGISAQDAARHNPRAKGWLDKVKEFFDG